MNDFPPDPPRLRQLRCVQWSGRFPEVGEYLVPAGPRSRIAYRIAQFAASKQRITRGGKVINPSSVGVFHCVSIRREQLPADAVQHNWYWVEREKRKTASVQTLHARQGLPV